MIKVETQIRIRALRPRSSLLILALPAIHPAAPMQTVQQRWHHRWAKRGFEQCCPLQAQKTQALRGCPAATVTSKSVLECECCREGAMIKHRSLSFNGYTRRTTNTTWQNKGFKKKKRALPDGCWLRRHLVNVQMEDGKLLPQILNVFNEAFEYYLQHWNWQQFLFNWSKVNPQQIDCPISLTSCDC